VNALAEAPGVHLAGVGQAAVESSRSAIARGARVIGWTSAASAVLSAAGVPHTRLVDELDPGPGPEHDPEMALYRASADWTRAFGHRASVEGEGSLRDALAYRDTTLWWWAELYLHHNTTAIRHVRAIEQIARVLEGVRGPVTAFGLSRDDETLVARWCARRASPPSGLRDRGLAASKSLVLRTALDAAKALGTAVKAGQAPLAPRDADLAGSILFLSHAAFWKTRPNGEGGVERYEHYLDPVLRATRERRWPVAILGVGPAEAHRTRSAAATWRERLRGSSAGDSATSHIHANAFVSPRIARETWTMLRRMRSVAVRTLRTSSTIEALSHRGVSFADAARGDVVRTLTHQCVWAARSLGEFDAAFRALRPRAICLYAETSGLGRAAVTAARALQIPSLGVQHGILYPNYFSMERTDDDVRRGTPMPDRTALYGQDGVRLLETTFRYPRGRAVATGAPQFDALAAASRSFDRVAARKRFGAPDGSPVVVLASRYWGIRETHKASGPAFPALLAALARIDGARLIVKPHPAEPRDAYDGDIARGGAGARVAVIANAPLFDLLAAADVLVTVESLSATEAIVASVPVIVLRHPSNLRGLVAAGVARGVPEGADPEDALRTFLFDERAIETWRGHRARFLDDAACGVDGRAAERLAARLGELAGLTPANT
jgi:hypothetical protein